MPRHRLASFAVLTLAAMTGITGCVTEPQPCTPEWIEWKSDRILNRFAKQNPSTIRALRDISGHVDNPSALTAIRIAALVGDFEGLARDFDRIVMPELNNAIAQCSQPRDFVPAFSQFLRKEGVGEDVIRWVEVIGYVAMETRQP